MIVDKVQPESTTTQKSRLTIIQKSVKNLFHRHLENAKKQLPFCQQAHTASVLTIYNWIRDNFIISLQDISIYNIYLQLL